MSRRTHITLAVILSIVATVVGWSQSLNYKDTPLIPMALWFPSIVLTNAHDIDAVGLSLIQFPIMAMGYCWGINRWPVARVLATLAIIYLVAAGIAVAMVCRISQETHQRLMAAPPVFPLQSA